MTLTALRYGKLYLMCAKNDLESIEMGFHTSEESS